MSPVFISKATMTDFREHLVAWTLREIHNLFRPEGIELDASHDPALTGERRTLVEQYYRTLNVSEWTDAKKLLRVYERVLPQAEVREREELVGLLNRDGVQYRDGRLQIAEGGPLAGALRSLAEHLDATGLSDTLQRLDGAVEEDPALAIGSAKELVETVCKTILGERGEEVPSNPRMPQLVKLAYASMDLTEESLPEDMAGRGTILQVLRSLSAAVQGLAELRNDYGTGHGRDGKAKRPNTRAARLAVGSARAVATFLLETHVAKSARDALDEDDGE